MSAYESLARSGTQHIEDRIRQSVCERVSLRPRGVNMLMRRKSWSLSAFFFSFLFSFFFLFFFL